MTKSFWVVIGLALLSMGIASAEPEEEAKTALAKGAYAEAATKFAEAMVKVKKGFAGQAFALFEGFGYGMGGFCMAFYFAWDVALITLAAVPLRWTWR